MTARLEAHSRGERFAVLALVVTIHVAIAFLIIAIRSTVYPPPVKAEGIAMISLAATPPSQAPPPPPKMPSKVADKKAELSAPATIYDESSSAGPPSAGCSTLASVSNALLADPVAVASVVNAPPEARSIAEAVVMWNAGWADTADLPNAPLGPVRAAVEKGLSAIPPTCLDEPIAGPRFVPIPDGERTMLLVFGSGQWTWRQLLAQPFPEAAQPASPDPGNGDFWDWFGGR